MQLGSLGLGSVRGFPCLSLWAGYNDERQCSILSGFVAFVTEKREAFSGRFRELFWTEHRNGEAPHSQVDAPR